MWQRIKRAMINKWDWWIFKRAHNTMFRLCKTDPAFAHLFKRQIETWQERMPMPDELKKSAGKFYEAITEEADKRVAAQKQKAWR